MNVSKLNRWVPALLVLGCGSKLEVDSKPPGGGGSGGSGAVGGSDVIVHVTPAGGGGTTGGGGAVDPLTPGSLGQSCIPSATATEANGSFAQADVTTPDRCNDGLTCGASGECLAIPDCPQATGICVVHRGNPDQGAGGAGGAGGYGAGGGPAGAAVAESGVKDLKASDTQLYWIDYGTRDSLGNYQNDGALITVPLAGGAPSPLAAALPGPVALGLTSTHAYLYVDGAPLIGSQLHPQLLRVPLAGGAPELVQDGTAPNWSRDAFLGVGDQAYWSTDTALYSQAPDTGAAPSVFLPNFAYALVADATDLYYVDVTEAAFWRAPFTGGAPESLALTPLPYALHGDSIYGIESINNNTGMILDQAPKSGGTWQRIRALGAGGVGQFQVVGDRYFVASNPPQVGPYTQPDYSLEDILTASFVSMAPPVRLLELSVTPNTSLVWVGTAEALYWTDGNTIYSRSLAGPP